MFNFVIWTTTPWTIPANLAICLNASYNYALVETEKEINCLRYFS